MFFVIKMNKIQAKKLFREEEKGKNSEVLEYI